MAEEEVKEFEAYHPADTNGDGKVSKKEQEMFLEFKRKRIYHTKYKLPYKNDRGHMIYED